MAKPNPFAVVFEQEDNPFAAIAPTRLPQSVIPQKVDNPFAAIFDAPNPAAPNPAALKPAAAQAPPSALGVAYSAGGGDPLVSTLQQAGFKGEALKTAWAIAKRESGGRAEAYNGDRGTGDQSYGLFQINMLGKMGPSRRQQFGLKQNEDLLDALTNAKAAFKMSHGGTDWGAWGIGPNAYRRMPALDLSGFPGASTLPYRGGAPNAQTLPYRGKPTKPGWAIMAPGADRPGVSIHPEVLDFVSMVATQHGRPLTIGTGTAHNQYVKGTHRESAHWTGRGADIPAAGSELTRLGQDALIAAGMPEAEARRQTGGVFNVGGKNILFNTYVGGNHYNHLHVGLSH